MNGIFFRKWDNYPISLCGILANKSGKTILFYLLCFMNRIGIIPARFASTRFPGKPLVMIHGKTMIQRVYEQAAKASLDFLAVATDNMQIYEHVKSFGGNVYLSSEEHATGTDRCFEVAEKIAAEQGKNPDIVINIQGDEPYVHPEQINMLAQAFQNPEVQIASLMKQLKSTQDLENSGIIKVTFRKNLKALYFSRAVIPFPRNTSIEEALQQQIFFKHIGLYAYRMSVLEKITQLETGTLEKVESLEQLRWLENGYEIQLIETPFETRSVDSPSDLEILLKEQKADE